MAKRKRESVGVANSGAKRPGESSEGSQGRESKRRKLSSSPSIDPAEICTELYDTIRNYRDEDGRILCEPFIRVPKRRGSPDYYEVVDFPIDLLKIQQRLKTDEYEDVETFSKDVELLLDNAAKYYKPDSQEHKDAFILKELFFEAKDKLCADEDEDGSEGSEKMEGDSRDEDWDKEGADSDENDETKDESGEKTKSKSTSKTGGKRTKKPLLPGDEDDNESTSTRDGDDSDGSPNAAFMEELVSAVLEMRDSHNRLVCELFKRLPPPSLYPEYYAIIKEPIDLKMICVRLRANHYSSLDELEKDLQVMVKNAHTFNEPGSQVYKNATSIKKMIQTKRAEIEHTLMGAKSSKRLKARRSTGTQSTAINALLEETDDIYGEGDAEMGEEFGDEGSYDDEDFGGADDLNNPLIELFNEIYTRTDPTGRALVEPFLRLPSRRAYPDYYEVIKNPIALSKIRSQIKSGVYESLDGLEKDMQLCFQNAQTYNEPNSMLYLDAQRLEEVMKRKKTEIAKMMTEKGITLEDFKIKKKTKKAEVPSSLTTTGEVDIKKKTSKTKTEVREKPKKVRKGEELDPVLMKKRMRQLFKAVASYQDENGRYLSAIFMELPSAQDYPDYYKVISEPVCLNQIECNIRDQKYSHEDEMILDFEVMFDNAKYYNEEDSQVHQDARTLSKVLMKKRKALGPLHPVSVSDSGAQQMPTKQATPTKSGRISSPSSAKKYSQVPSATNELKELCKELFNAVKDCTDGSGRQLCIIFQKLPSRNDYPDYYSLIKRPIDMAKIASKLHADQYQTLDDFLSDFLQMFDNACRYNDPDSQVYKDALTLQRELLRKKAELVGEESKVPHIPSVVRKLLGTLYYSVMQHVDDDGRCFSDSLAEFSVSLDDEGHMRQISLATVGEDLRKGYYHRLDQLQEDIFSVLEKARELRRSDDEMYDDAAELQQYFVAERDKLCKDGERFISPALLVVTRRHLQQELDDDRKNKAEAESREDAQLREIDRREGRAPEAINEEACVSELTHQGILYRVGDFVYIEPRKESDEPNVVFVEKLWTNANGEECVFGSWFYKIERTRHISTRKFLENEIFKSSNCAPVKLNQVCGKCCVMFVKNYFKQKPEGFSEEHVFVCESSYNMKRRTFRKLKSWSMPPSNVEFVTRGELLSQRRTQRVDVRMPPREIVGSVERTGPNDDSKKNAVNVVLESAQNPEEGCTYFEQFCVRGVPYKLGDYVYVRTDEDFFNIARIDKIWSDRSGICWFHGPWFVGPADIQHLPTRMFHEKEVFLSSLEETTPIMNVNGKCCVLAIREYCRCRPTEIPEKDIYLNEARYDEEEGQFRKLKGLKRFTLTLNVQEDEYFFFEEAVTPSKVPSPLLMDEQDFVRDEQSVSPSSSTDLSEPGKKQKKQKPQSGYLIFSHEMRNIVRKDHPEYAFGEISRIVGVEWRNLSAVKKAEYEARAQMQLGQGAAETSVDSHPSLTGPFFAYCCLWRGCDHQYEDLQDLKIHVLDNTGHMQKSEDGIFHCLWTTCMRQGRGLRPFNASSKLFRHCREVHLMGPPRQILPHERSKNFFPRHQAVLFVPSPEPPPASRPQAPAVGTNTQGNVMGVIPGTPQPSNVPSSSMTNQNYLGGRLTPQSLQQAMYQGSGAPAGYGGQAVAQNLNQAAQIMQRQMSIGSTGPNIGQTQTQTTPMQGQVPPYQQPQPQQQQFNQSQPNQFNFQQQMNQIPHLQQQAAASPPPPPPPQMAQQYQQPTTPVQTQPAAMPYKEIVQPAPVFIAPPSKPQRLYHSDAYLRYIEGLRDGRSRMSQWNQAQKPTLTPQQISQLPTHWLGSGYGNYENPVDALWALSDYMLRDSLSLSTHEGC